MCTAAGDLISRLGLVGLKSLPEAKRKRFKRSNWTLRGQDFPSTFKLILCYSTWDLT